MIAALENQWKILEMAYFPIWKVADEDERSRICKEIAKIECVMFKKELDKKWKYATNTCKNENGNSS